MNKKSLQKLILFLKMKMMIIKGFKVCFVKICNEINQNPKVFKNYADTDSVKVKKVF